MTDRFNACIKFVLDHERRTFAMGIYRQLLLVAFPERADKRKSYMKLWRLMNSHRVREYTRSYRMKNRASYLKGHRASSRKWRNENITESRTRALIYYHAHPELLPIRRKRGRLWYQANRASVYAKNQMRRAKQRQVMIGDPAKIAKVFARARELRKWFNVEVDHIIPLSKNGGHCESNLQIIYASENKRKNDKLGFAPSIVFA